MCRIYFHMSVIMLKIGLVFIILYVADIVPSYNNYGPFAIKILDACVCKGPKRKNCTSFRIGARGDTNLTYDLEVKENVAPIKGKIMSSLDGKNAVKIGFSKPCEHIFMRPIMNTVLKVTDACVILKGHYTFEMNMAELIYKYYGGQFLYGNWTYKIIFFNEDCNFTCNEIKIAFIPKKKSNI